MLKQRVITAIILAPLVLAGILYLPPELFAGFALLIVLLGAWEWADLSQLDGVNKVAYLVSLGAVCGALFYTDATFQVGLLYLAFPLWILMLWWVTGYPQRSGHWAAPWRRALLGFAILLCAWVSLVQLKLLRSDGLLIILLLLIIWSADIGAYFSGRAWGRVELAPKVSPGKSWEGVVGGMLCAVTLCWMFAYAFGLLQADSLRAWFYYGALALVVAAVSVLGDLAESMIKRQRGVKDSGRLLPGHGGMMDRIDSLVAGLPFYTLIILSAGKLGPVNTNLFVTVVTKNSPIEARGERFGTFFRSSGK